MNLSRPLRVPMVHQTAATDCAAACLAMMARRQGVPAGLSDVRERLDPGRDGVSARALRDVGKELGMPMKALRVTPDAPALAALPTPFIAHLDRQHYVVVERVTPTRVHLADPAVGRRMQPLPEFLAEASGVVFVVDADQPRRAAGSGEQSAERLVLLPLVRQLRTRLLLAALASVLLTVLGLVVPASTAALTNLLAAGSTPGSAWLGLAGGLVVAVGTLALARGLLLALLQREVGRRLSTSVADTLFSRSFRFFERRSTGDLFGRVASADMVRDVLGQLLIGAVLDSALALGYLVALAILAPPLAAVTALVLALGLIVVVALTRRSVTRRREEIVVGAEADTMLVDALSGIATIRTSGSDALVARGWLERVARRFDLARRRAYLTAGAEAALAALRVAAPVLFLVVAAQSSASPGAAIGLAALAGATLVPLSTLAAQIAQASELRPLLERLADVERAPAERRGGVDPGPIRGEIRLQNLGFRYDRRSPFVLRGLDAHIPAGAKVGVLGATGCGKSTLAGLISGLHDPVEGSILVDGQDLASLDLTAWRRQLGAVLQDTWLGGPTIRDALVAGRVDVSDEQLYRALHSAAVLPEVLAMPLGLDTPLSEGGRGVSVGQRQRLALARALVSDPSVLILDEATSALDVGTEAVVEQHLRSLQITRIVIAHRLSTVADADLLLVIGDSGLAEIGTPSQLAASGGRYAQMLGRAELAPAV